MFKGHAFLKKEFKNPSGVVSFLTQYGAPVPSTPQAEQWFRRGSIPGPWLACLLAYLEADRGQPVSLTPYIGARQ